MKEIRCIVCRTEFEHDELEGNAGCPICGYEGLTMLTNGDINIDINWFELRLICMWAEALALQVGDTHSTNAFYSAVKQIKQQIPDAGRITMFDESPDVSVKDALNFNDAPAPNGTLYN